MRTNRAIALTAAVCALGLTLSACSKDEEENPSPTPSESTTETAEGYAVVVPPADPSTPVEPGSTLVYGETAVLDRSTLGDSTGFVGLAVVAVEPGTVEQLTAAGVAADVLVGKLPFYVHINTTNLSDEDAAGVTVRQNVVGVLDDGTASTETIDNPAEFPACPAGDAAALGAKGTSVDDCVLVLVPEGRDVVGAGYTFGQPFDALSGVTWI